MGGFVLNEFYISQRLVDGLTERGILNSIGCLNPAFQPMTSSLLTLRFTVHGRSVNLSFTPAFNATDCIPSDRVLPPNLDGLDFLLDSSLRETNCIMFDYGAKRVGLAPYKPIH